MGINIADVKWMLLMKKKHHVDYSRVAMLGRQCLFVNRDKSLSPFLNVKDIIQEDGYSEKYWSFLAGKEAETDSFDFSDYEHANVIHDMNIPVPDEYKGKYSIVFDGGTLEHVFNYPVALHNAMSMVRGGGGGGYLILATPANNECGHGFYQFSPELFFSVLSEANGFKVLDMTAVVHVGSVWRNIVHSKKQCFRYFSLKDNTKTGRRLLFGNKFAVYVHVLAKRIGDIPPLDRMTVQQSDYIKIWNPDLSGDTPVSKAKLLLGRHKILYKTASALYHCYERIKNPLIVEYDINKELRNVY